MPLLVALGANLQPSAAQHVVTVAALGRACDCYLCTGTELLPTSAPALGPPHATSAPGLGSPLPHLHRDWAHPMPHPHRNWARLAPIRSAQVLQRRLHERSRSRWACRTDDALDEDISAILPSYRQRPCVGLPPDPRAAAGPRGSRPSRAGGTVACIRHWYSCALCSYGEMPQHMGDFLRIAPSKVCLFACLALGVAALCVLRRIRAQRRARRLVRCTVAWREVQSRPVSRCRVQRVATRELVVQHVAP